MIVFTRRNLWGVLITYCLFTYRGQCRSMPHCNLIHPPQFLGIWSRLVQAVPGGPYCLFPACHRTKGKPCREPRTLKDSVWISHCQLWHFPGGRCWSIHPRGNCSTSDLPCSSSHPQPWWGCSLTVLPAGQLLILWPHAPRVALGLDARPGFTGVIAMLTLLKSKCIAWLQQEHVMLLFQSLFLSWRFLYFGMTYHIICN